jgi:hypothetical protein
MLEKLTQNPNFIKTLTLKCQPIRFISERSEKRSKKPWHDGIKAIMSGFF